MGAKQGIEVIDKLQVLLAAQCAERTIIAPAQLRSGAKIGDVNPFECLGKRVVVLRRSSVGVEISINPTVVPHDRGKYRADPQVGTPERGNQAVEELSVPADRFTYELVEFRQGDLVSPVTDTSRH